jgi:hypothetical protein
MPRYSSVSATVECPIMCGLARHSNVSTRSDPKPGLRFWPKVSSAAEIIRASSSILRPRRLRLLRTGGRFRPVGWLRRPARLLLPTLLEQVPYHAQGPLE